MTGTPRIPALAAPALALALGLGACGDDSGDPIPQGKADALIAELDGFQGAMDAGECETVDDRIEKLRSGIGTLSSDGVGDDVIDALADGVDRLRTLAHDVEQCRQQEPVETTATETTETETTETQTVPTTTVPTTTTPTTPVPTTPTTTTPTTTIPQPDDGGVGPDGNGPPGQLKQRPGGEECDGR